jgi:predicted 3-demethylubiquinone-9 3-methyltransferase (glyoxalase superfamily)
MQKITPFLWFDNQAVEAANFYVSLFKNSKVHAVNNLGAAVTTVSFELDGQPFMAMNAGPMFKFNEAISMMVDCDGQEEVDRLWKALTADGGEESMCGWLKDKYGLSWQITPRQLIKCMSDPDPEKAGRVMEAMMQMRKIDIAKIEAAHAG